MLVVLMGVAGSGKSTIGTLLAARLGIPFVEGDDFHDPASIARMAAGHPLSEAERGPWLDRLHARLAELQQGGAVCACSALTESSRRRLTDGFDDVRFVWLHGSPELMAERLAHRHGNPVGVSLLPSQLATLEPPISALDVDVRRTPEEIVDQVLDWLAGPV
jgi:carbohydrate kinase (thermoresistant glucokinase family)